MVVGVVSWELSLPGCASLKDKRMVVRSLKDRLRHKFNVSVAETGFQDARARAQLTAAYVAADRRQADSIKSKVDRFVESDGRAVIVDVHEELY